MCLGSKVGSGLHQRVDQHGAEGSSSLDLINEVPAWDEMPCTHSSHRLKSEPTQFLAVAKSLLMLLVLLETFPDLQHLSGGSDLCAVF